VIWTPEKLAKYYAELQRLKKELSDARSTKDAK